MCQCLFFIIFNVCEHFPSTLLLFHRLTLCQPLSIVLKTDVSVNGNFWNWKRCRIVIYIAKTSKKLTFQLKHRLLSLDWGQVKNKKRHKCHKHKISFWCSPFLSINVPPSFWHTPILSVQLIVFLLHIIFFSFKINIICADDGQCVKSIHAVECSNKAFDECNEEKRRRWNQMTWRVNDKWCFGFGSVGSWWRWWCLLRESFVREMAICTLHTQHRLTSTSCIRSSFSHSNDDVYPVLSFNFYEHTEMLMIFILTFVGSQFLSLIWPQCTGLHWNARAHSKSSRWFSTLCAIHFITAFNPVMATAYLIWFDRYRWFFFCFLLGHGE